MKTIRFTEVREFHERNLPEGRPSWFEPGAMAFFSTSLPEVAYELDCGGIYFITSERGDPSWPLKYSVRRQLHDGRITTVGEFAGYSTRSQAKAAIKAIEKEGVAQLKQLRDELAKREE